MTEMPYTADELLRWQRDKMRMTVSWVCGYIRDLRKREVSDETIVDNVLKECRLAKIKYWQIGRYAERHADILEV